MPGLVWLTIPPDVVPTDPVNDEPLLDRATSKPCTPISWEHFIKCLCCTPAFKETDESRQHLEEVLKALRYSCKDGVMGPLAQDDWVPLFVASGMLRSLPFSPLSYPSLKPHFESVRNPLKIDPRIAR